MCHVVLGRSNFWSLLFRIDEDFAAETHAGGCRFCGGVLHRADYQRKPRGVVRSLLGAGHGRRLSFCCERDGCRRRHTPPSVRFLGRRAFLGAVIVLATAMAHGLTGRRVARLSEQFGVSLRTLRRWQRWWREDFAAEALWRGLRGLLAVPLTRASLPGSLLAGMTGVGGIDRLVELLRLLAPLSSSSSVREGS